MIQRAKSHLRARQPAANLVPTFEECLTFVMANLGYSRDSLRSSTLSPKEKQLFRQMERKADALDLRKYREILRRVLNPALHDMAADSKVYVNLLQDELKEFFKRYELLSWQVIPGSATSRQVVWELSHRFCLPWLALRIAFHLPDVAKVGITPDDCWFVPVREGALDSCVMKVIDQFVRQQAEPNTRMTRRLYQLKPQNSDRRLSRDEISKRAEWEEEAHLLESNLSKYQKLKTSPTSEIVELLVGNTPDVPHLRLILVLARFIDRCVRHARNIFDDRQLLELVRYFWLSFTHFRGAIKQVCSETSDQRLENIWLHLSSRNFLGNTAGQLNRFYPLVDEFMNELSRNINAELRQTGGCGRLSSLPRNDKELNAGIWPFPSHARIPKEIEGAPFRSTVSSAIEFSGKTFKGRVNLDAVLRTIQIFERLGVRSFIDRAEGRRRLCSDEHARLADAECKRLFKLIYAQTPAHLRRTIALKFFVYLIEPYRPKTIDDGKRARQLFKIVCQSLQHYRLFGAIHFLQGSLLALDGDQKRALTCFVDARAAGRESCGQFWINLIKTSLMTAEQVGSKRETKNFSKLARLYGIFSNDGTPRTNEMQSQMNEEAFRHAWLSGYKPFP